MQKMIDSADNGNVAELLLPLLLMLPPESVLSGAASRSVVLLEPSSEASESTWVTVTPSTGALAVEASAPWDVAVGEAGVVPVILRRKQDPLTDTSYAGIPLRPLGFGIV